MNTIVPSENIIKLRELTKKISHETPDNYEIIVKKLKDVVDEGKTKIINSENTESKIKCYESMCTTITNLLTSVKII